MKKLFTYTLLLCTFLANEAVAQFRLWGMSSQGGGQNGGGNIFSINKDGTAFQEEHAYLRDGSASVAHKLLDYGDGFLYGITATGGIDAGVLYKVRPDGTGYKIIHNFLGASGSSPNAGVIKGADGFLYGTATAGGTGGYGVVYKVGTDGSGYLVLHTFNNSQGANPVFSLYQSASGFLYGLTQRGGPADAGLIYQLTPDGSAFQVKHNFTGTDGMYPSGDFLPISFSNVVYLYGVTQGGGANGSGVLYSIRTDDWTFQSLYSFTTAKGVAPQASLMAINNPVSGWNLYGTARNGGPLSGGVVYDYNINNGTYTVLHSFQDAGNNISEKYPIDQLTLVNGVLYGSTQGGGNNGDGVIFKINQDGTGYQVTYHYTDPNGSFGNLSLYNNQIYGITGGGLLLPSGYSNGTIYRLNPDGSGFQVLHNFNCPDGYSPSGSLIKAQDGNLYGMTTYGGSGYSDGVLFSIKTDGTTYSPLTWVSDIPSGGHPLSSLVQAGNGSLYGVNKQEGTAPGALFGYNPGTSSFQKITPFCLAPGCGDFPIGSLMQTTQGDLYGMTSTSGVSGTGTIFTLKPDLTGFSILHTFSAAEGAGPSGSLIEGADHSLYGMTPNGGSNGDGVIFKIIPGRGTIYNLFQFGIGKSGLLFGRHPMGSLLPGIDGKLYGLTSDGGSGGAGTVFRINTDGTGLKVLLAFTGANGANPVGSLIQDPSGTLYGMTQNGGLYNLGSIFSIAADGTGYQKLLDFNGSNGAFPKGDLLLVTTSTTTMAANNKLSLSGAPSLQNESVVALSVYPNPTHNSFTLSLQLASIGKVGLSLADVQGRILEQCTIEKPEGVLSHTWDLSRYASGLYVLKVVTHDRVYVKTILKQ